MPLTSEGIAERCRADGEFRLASRFWDGSLELDLGAERLAFTLAAGQIRPGIESPADIRIAGPAATWERLLSPLPPPLFNDIMPARAFGLTVAGNDEMFSQYFPAIRRMVDILREERAR